MQSEWDIKSRAHTCARTGHEFVEGEFFYTLLFREGEGFRREDVSEDAWQVGELGHAFGDADANQRLVQRYLAWCGRKQILAAQDMRDLHQRVVYWIDQGVQRISTGAGQGEIGHDARRERGLPADEVVPRDVLCGHP